MKKNILITIADGYHYRYLIDTNIVKLLAQKHHLIIATTPSFFNLVNEYLVEGNLDCTLLSFTPEFTRKKRFVQNLYKKITFYSNEKFSETLNIKNETRSKKDKYFLDIFFSFLKFTPSLIHKIKNYLESSFCNSEIKKIFVDNHVDFLITSTPGQKEFDLSFLYHAKHSNIKSLSPVYSWDNLTAKGPFYFHPDYLIVWNDIMVKEGIYYHNYDHESIFACGVPVFDLYPEIINSSKTSFEFKKEIGFKNDLPLITITTIPQIYFSNSHLTLAKMLIEEKGKSLPDFLLLIRPHPMDETDYSSLNIFSDVVIDEYGSKPDKSLKNWKPSVNNIFHLGNTMKHSDVVLNIASTITIDAACFDTPIINIGFDLKSKSDDYLGSINRYYDYTHYKHIVECNATFLAKSFDDLIKYINCYINQPSTHRKERSLLVERQTFKLDGHSATRIVDKINFLLE